MPLVLHTCLGVQNPLDAAINHMFEKTYIAKIALLIKGA